MDEGHARPSEIRGKNPGLNLLRLPRCLMDVLPETQLSSLIHRFSHTFSLKHRGYVAGIQEASLQVELKCIILELIRKIENDRAIGTFAQRFHTVVEGGYAGWKLAGIFSFWWQQG